MAWSRLLRCVQLWTANLNSTYPTTKKPKIRKKWYARQANRVPPLTQKPAAGRSPYSTLVNIWKLWNFGVFVVAVLLIHTDDWKLHPLPLYPVPQDKYNPKNLKMHHYFHQPGTGTDVNWGGAVLLELRTNPRQWMDWMVFIGVKQRNILDLHHWLDRSSAMGFASATLSICSFGFQPKLLPSG